MISMTIRRRDQNISSSLDIFTADRSGLVPFGLSQMGPRWIVGTQRYPSLPLNSPRIRVTWCSVHLSEPQGPRIGSLKICSRWWSPGSLNDLFTHSGSHVHLVVMLLWGYFHCILVFHREITGTGQGWSGGNHCLVDRECPEQHAVSSCLLPPCHEQVLSHSKLSANVWMNKCRAAKRVRVRGCWFLCSRGHVVSGRWAPTPSSNHPGCMVDI